MYAEDFDNSLCAIIDASLVVGIGGSLTGLTIYGVNHTPGLLDLGGATAGVSGGVTLSPLLYMYVDHKHPRQNQGCLILPEGDPMCGGTSASGPNQSKSTTMSSAR